MKREERSLSGFMSKDSVANQKIVNEMDFVGGNLKIPMVNMRGWGMDIMRKRHSGEFFVKPTPGRKSFGENTVGLNHIRKLMPRSIYFNKRALGMEFIGKRASRTELDQKESSRNGVCWEKIF